MPHAIEIRNLSKQYRLGESLGGRNLRETFTLAWRRDRRPAGERTLLSLQGIDLDVPEGEVLGIIGRNGAGKSTLLKVVSGITAPTTGSVRVRGRLASLLEVGTGFHDELTGRENIFLNGSVLGMRRRDIIRRLDEIVEFAGVGAFMDTPLKRYSSGMKLRLGFAVAAHLDPDILVVDEVLAVGDAEFQKKCLNTMEGLRYDGRTVLFVAHNMAAIEHLCPRAIWIDRGLIHSDGPAHEVIQAYMRSFATASASGADLEGREDRTGDGAGRFAAIELLDGEGTRVLAARSGAPLTLRLHVRVHRDIRDPVVGINLHTEFGALLTASNNWATGDDMPALTPGSYTIDLRIDPFNVLPGRFYLTLWLGKWHSPHDVLQHVLALDVEPGDPFGSGRVMDGQFGLLYLMGRWSAPVRGATRP